jgi:hypothetical protein
VTGVSVTATDQLRNALRSFAGIDALGWTTPTTLLHGGFWAEMDTVEFVNPPLGGPHPCAHAPAVAHCHRVPASP